MFITQINDNLMFSAHIINKNSIEITETFLQNKPNAIAEIGIHNNKPYWNIITTFDEYQIKIINTSKEFLSNYLQNNPIKWTNNKFYSITLEKQQLLQIQLNLYTQAKTNNLEYKLMWNATGEETEEWQYEDLLNLSLTINNFVQPLVQYQQRKEIEIKNCQTIDELNQIIINYSTLE